MNAREPGLVAAGLLAAIYFASAKLSLLAAVPPGYATAVWPPSGIAVAAILLLGWRACAGVWLGAVLVNITVHQSFIAAILMGTGNTLEVLVCAWLVRRNLGSPREFNCARDVFIFTAIAILSPTIAATIAVLPLAWVHGLSSPELMRNWWTWWLGDAMGIILITPLILSWSAGGQPRWAPRRAAEAAALAAGALLACFLIFGNVAAPDIRSPFSLEFLILPFIMWVAVRFRQREVATMSAAVSAVAIAMTVLGHGPFAAGSLGNSLPFLLAFMGTVAVTGLVLGAAVRERTWAQSSLGNALRQLREEATHDVLTGLYNRRFLEDCLHRELARARRGRRHIAVIMLDIDFFKRVNDRLGHAAGDAALVSLGALLKRHVRTSDVACRYGGEEFTLVLPETSLTFARRKAEAIRQEVEHASGPMADLTISLGVAIYPEHGANADSLMQAADKALYKAKQAGRNRVEVSSDRAIRDVPERGAQRVAGP